MSKKKPILAIMYDFDRTLCTKDMQEYSFIPNLEMTAKSFWKESNGLAVREKMDRILAYMFLMIEKSQANHSPVKRENFVELGKNIEFFEGVEEWFSNINALGKAKGVKVEHYIISSGLKEIIEGTPINKHFKEVYACEFYYDHNDLAVWPKVTVNYTAKTQFLFRINKGVLDISNDIELNRFTPENERRIPFGNMIYIGDGLTDVPCMKLVKSFGGTSIAVYPSRKKKKIESLLIDERVDYLTKANYSADSELYEIVSTVIEKVAAENKLAGIHKKHINGVTNKSQEVTK